MNFVRTKKEKERTAKGHVPSYYQQKVKGKDFRKEMAKKKKASWRGGGAIDQGVNSIKFDSDSE